MERTPLINNKNGIITLFSAADSRYVLNQHGVLQFVIEENTNIDLLISDYRDNDELTFEVKKNSHLHVALLAKETAKSVKITANVKENASIEFYFADFISGQTKGDIAIYLEENKASCDWHLASLSQGHDKKEFDVSVYHKSALTFAKLDNYGVIRDEGKLTFSGICHILNGSHGSKAHQNAKIMVFDELSNGIAKPILKIDENDIEASHAAVVGKINDEHIFYLTSRGLSEDEAKRIITLGYLKPILKGFSDESMKEYIEKLIEGNM